MSDWTRTDSVNVAISAQKKLRHMVLILKEWLISCMRVSVCRRRVNRQQTSIENSTPPMGAPNATATPAAEAAVIMSRILPEPRELAHNMCGALHTMTSSELVKQARDGVANAGCDVYRWTFLPD